MVISPIEFLKEVRAEMRNVSWPTKEETIRLTVVVVGISLLVGIFVGILDFIFTNLFALIIK